MEDGQTRGALFKKPVVAAPPNALAAPAALPAARLAVVRTSVSDCQFCTMAAVTPVPSAPAFFPGTAALLTQSPAITAAHPTYKYVTRLPIGSWRASLGPSAPEPRHLGLHRTELLAAKAVASRLGVQVADLERAGAGGPRPSLKKPRSKHQYVTSVLSSHGHAYHWLVAVPGHAKCTRADYGEAVALAASQSGCSEASLRRNDSQEVRLSVRDLIVHGWSEFAASTT